VERAYAAWRTFQDRFLAYVAALLMLGCTLLALTEVGRRYVLGLSYEWQADAVTYIILSGVFLYFGIAQRRDSHLNVTLLVTVLEAMGPRARHAAAIIDLVARIFAFLFLLAVAWWGIPEVSESIRYETRTESLAFPMWPFLLTLLVGFVLMAITMFFQIYRGINKLLGRSVLEEAPEPDVMPD
jgi:TRAP-type C4-dicarboxylate transport system permease small subunit